MNFKSVAYERSFGTADQLPPSTLAEVVFAGRSNVGKSSLLNCLFNRKNLARISQTPGKTTTINFFKTDDARFVDLPGYGYAKVSKSEKARWSELIEGYFAQKRQLTLVVPLVDIRHAASDLDVRMIAFLEQAHLPFVVALTKADKISRQKRMKQLRLLRNQLQLESKISLVVSSASSGEGMDELRGLIERSLER